MWLKVRRLFSVSAGMGLLAAAAASSAAFAQAAPPAAGAGVSYTLTASESAVKSQLEMSTDVAAQGPMQRYDSEVKLPSGRSFRVVNVLDGASGKLYTSDPELNLYTVSDPAQVRPDLFGVGTLLPGYTLNGLGLVLPLPDLRIASQSGEIGMSVAVADAGTEPVGKRKNAHHSTVTLTYATSGGAAVPFATETYEVWTDDSEPQPISLIDERLLSGGQSGTSLGGVTYTLTGDVDKLRAVLSAVPVRIVYSYTSGPQDDATSSVPLTYSLDKYSAKPIDAKQFAAPSGKMKEVAPDVFQQDERAALVARVRNGGGGYNDTAAGIRGRNPLGSTNIGGDIIPNDAPNQQGLPTPVPVR